MPPVPTIPDGASALHALAASAATARASRKASGRERDASNRELGLLARVTMVPPEQ
jgi:hypothetical protein